MRLFDTTVVLSLGLVSLAQARVLRLPLGRLNIPKCPLTDDGFVAQEQLLSESLIQASSRALDLPEEESDGSELDATAEPVALSVSGQQDDSLDPSSVASRLARRQQARYRRARVDKAASSHSKRKALRSYDEEKDQAVRQEAEEERALREMRNQAEADKAFTRGEWQGLDNYGNANSSSSNELANVDKSDEEISEADDDDEEEDAAHGSESWWPFSTPGNSSNAPDTSYNDASTASADRASHSKAPAPRPSTRPPTTSSTTTTTTMTTTTTTLPYMAPPPASQAPRVYFLFLVQNGLDHPELWRSFFQGQDPSKFRALIHCKSQEACKSSGIFTLIPELRMVDTVETFYCHDLVTAMVHLLDGALKEGSGIGASRDKFVFVSESALPVKPFSTVHTTLTANHDSDMCIFPKSHWATAHVGTTKAYLVKQHQWVTLNRAHAEVMVRDWAAVDAGGHWSVPLDSPGWSGDYNASSFEREPIANWCTDEWAFFATIYGAIPDDGFDTSVSLRDMGAGSLDVSGPAAATMQGTCRTFAFFNEDGAEFASTARDIAMDPQSKLSCWPACQARPTTFLKLSDASLQTLRKSPFLFARKFDKHAFDKGSYQRYIFDMQDSTYGTSSASSGNWSDSWPFLLGGKGLASEGKEDQVSKPTQNTTLEDQQEASKEAPPSGFLHKRVAQTEQDDDEVEVDARTEADRHEADLKSVVHKRVMEAEKDDDVAEEEMRKEDERQEAEESGEEESGDDDDDLAAATLDARVKEEVKQALSAGLGTKSKSALTSSDDDEDSDDDEQDSEGESM